jgi:predicted phosphodiesterase
MARKVAELNEENNELTKILILSDTHGREDYLQVMEECQADVVIHAGDFEEFSNPDYEVEDELKDQRFTH